jgi:hypothetical protein
MQCTNAQAWHHAAVEEIKAHQRNNTWRFTECPPNTRPISGRWVFTLKRTPSGHLKHKARFVAKGYSQKYGIDYDETYSSVLHMTSLRLIIASVMMSLIANQLQDGSLN